MAELLVPTKRIHIRQIKTGVKWRLMGTGEKLDMVVNHDDVGIPFYSCGGKLCVRGCEHYCAES